MVSKTRKLLKSYQIAFLQYVVLSNKSYHIWSIYRYGLLIIHPEVNNKSYHISSISRFGFLTIRPDFVV